MVATAQDNPFLRTAGNYVWAIETLDETPVSQLVFMPARDTMGDVFVFPHDWEPDDPIAQVHYFLQQSGGENIITFATSEAGSIKESTTYQYEFLDDEHFVLYLSAYPLDILNPRNVKVPVYQARLVPD